MNFNKQIEWDSYIYDRLTYYKQIYDKGKKKFVKFSESPTKPRSKIKWVVVLILLRDLTSIHFINLYYR